ncbi:MAG: FtsX-like permease family protein [Nannocystaceae bacterium]
MFVDWFLAVRILRDARLQTLLIIVGVGVGVAVMIFLSALISGLQLSLIDKTLGTLAQVAILPPPVRARPLLPDGPQRLRRVETAPQRVRSIDGWQQLLRSLELEPDVIAVSPSASAPVFAVRGNGTESVVLKGIDADRFDGVVHYRSRIVAGEASVAGRDALVGIELASTLGIGVGDQLRLQAADGTSELFTVRGQLDLGNRVANSSWVLVSLRNAQTLLDLNGGVSVIELSVSEIYEADAVARRLRERTGLRVRSWMEANAELLTALRSQSASSGVIQAFVILAVAIGIASVLVVSVIQRSREIGILRAMGTPRARILRVFLIQGAVVGVVGSVVGSLLGAGMATGFRAMMLGPSGQPLFPIALEPGLFVFAGVVATATGLLSALLPARRAAGLDPATAIRND